MNGLLLWLYEIPTFWLCVFFIAVFLIFSLAGLRLTRPWVRKHGSDGNDLANAYIAAAGVFYALLVGLISVATWENYSDVESNAAEEAAAVSDLYRDFEGYPPEMRAAVQEKLRRYVHHVIEEEWPAQSRGIEPEEHTRLAAELSRHLATFEPATQGQQILHAEVLNEFNGFLTYRRLRLQAVDSGLPQVMWFVVLIGAVITIGMTWFLWADNLRMHVLLTSCLAIMIALVIFLIFVLDEPLVGRVSVDSSSFQEVLTTVMGETK